jgi:hypothetical protein
MATGRTVFKHSRVYIDGYDLSGYSRSFGPLGVSYAAEMIAALTDGVKNTLPNHATISPGVINGIFDNTATSGLHDVLGSAGNVRTTTLKAFTKEEFAEIVKKLP